MLDKMKRPSEACSNKVGHCCCKKNSVHSTASI